MSEPTQTLQPLVEKLFARYVEEHVLGGVPPQPEELCASQPELLGPLREHIREYRRLRRDLAPPGDLEPGRELLHYRIVEKLGEGGMGQVYAAEDSRLGRRVALKVLPPELADNAERRERLRREARAVAALNHPSIVTVHAIEEAEGLSFLTMELVEGTRLSAAIPARGLPQEELLDLAARIADAVAAAHERGVTHRDLKPENIMVGAGGAVKVLDFGLAKQAPGVTAGDATSAPLTETGRLLGTVPYMSPEQLGGRPADARSDVFSLGILFYQMAAGRRPFSGDSPAELISALLRDTPSPLGKLRGDLPGQLGAIVARCLEKDPSARYPSARELCDDLRRLTDEVASGTAATAAAVRRRRRRTPWWWLAAAALALAAAPLAFWLRPVPPAAESVASSAVESAAPSLAVLYFQNLKGEPELDWLRGGITEMLVTDLSQSPDLKVLSTSRLHQILAEMDALEEPALSFERIRGVAEKAGADAVVRGSFARAGELLRIAFTLEEAASGEVLETFRVEERGEEALFAMVDELAGAIRTRFEVARRPGSPASIESVTTSSLKAWRLFSEAFAFQRQSKRREAIALLEQAVETDPTFALALANLGRAYDGLGETTKARRAIQRAVELADRLPVDQRLEIEALHYAGRWATIGRGIEVYERAVRLYPERTSLRNNLANLYTDVERYDDAIREYRVLIDGGTSFPGTYTAVANAHAALGRFEEGYSTLLEFATSHPDNWLAQLGLGWHLTEWGKLDDAAERFDRAAELRPGEPFPHYGRWRLQVLREDWQEAEREAVAIQAAKGSFARWRGLVSRARNVTFQGHTAAAAALLTEAIAAYPETDAFSALARCWKAELLLARGELDAAFAEAEKARELGAGEWPGRLGLFLAALARQALGQSAEAGRLEAELRRLTGDHPIVIEERQRHHLAGRLALLRGDPEGALEPLQRAAALLPPEGIESHWHVYPDHVAIWHALGEAELGAGRPQQALGWLRRAVSSGAEHVESPLPYVRSHYLLGRALRQLGDESEARRHLEHFAELWRDGDLDRAQVAESLSGPNAAGD